MAESREVQALQKISAEVDESQIKVLCSTKCIRAQAHLADKLRKKADRLKDTYSFITRANLKLQSEISQAQLDIKSLHIAHETIKMANVELKKEWLLAKDKKIEVMERVKNGEKKYEDLWLDSKARFESLPFVQKLSKAKHEVQILEQDTTKLDNEKTILIEKIRAKTEICLELDRKRIIELADFIVNEMPNHLNIIRETSSAIIDLTNELNHLAIKTKAVQNTEDITLHNDTEHTSKTENWPVGENINDRSSIMPKLQLSYLDFDALSVKLDEAKIKASNKTPIKDKAETLSSTHVEVDTSKADMNLDNTGEYSSFFNMPSVVYEDNKPKSYAKMKLINILEDIQIDTNEALNMMAKANPKTLLPVDSISEDKNTDVADEVLKNKDNKTLVSEEIEEIDLTTSKPVLLLMPPTQYQDTSLEKVSQKVSQEEALNLTSTFKSKETQDLSQAYKASQEHLKKKVSFELSNTFETNNGISETENFEMANETPHNQLDVSAVSDDGFAKMKDMIMKKHNLDLSPQFVYAKNVITTLQTEDAVVTSKFFRDDMTKDKEGRITIDNKEVCEIADNIKDTEQITSNNFKKNSNIVAVDEDFDADIVSSPKREKISEKTQLYKMSGFLNNNDVLISESLDTSMNTTGYEDGDEDYPRCIDSSLLLSPKADVPMSTGENIEVLSQDVPNFLSGLRKTGLSFFGRVPPSEPKPGSSTSNPGGSGFSFNFGGEEKKSRGGLFSMFQ